MRSLPPEEAERRLAAGELRVVDVRSPAEFEGLGHIPGAVLLPLGLFAVAPVTLADDGPPWLVCCEHGIRSARAVAVLEQAGLTGAFNLAGGMAAWGGARDFAAGEPFGARGPSSWIVGQAELWPRGGRALDVACGRGRHALLLAGAGLEVTAVDRDAGALAALDERARRLGLAVRTAERDLETGEAPFGEDRYDLIVVVSYLHRPLFPHLIAALNPGGLLLYETFTRRQAESGHPRSPEYLLEEGELRRLIRPLEVLREREGQFEGRWVAAVAARRPVATT